MKKNKKKANNPVEKHDILQDCNEIEEVYSYPDEKVIEVLEPIENKYCPRWNCRNADGSLVELWDRSDHLYCGHCYTKYYK